jgi:hypothetical protein
VALVIVENHRIGRLLRPRAGGANGMSVEHGLAKVNDPRAAYLTRNDPSVIANGSEAIQAKARRTSVWIASSLRSLAMTACRFGRDRRQRAQARRPFHTRVAPDRKASRVGAGAPAIGRRP